MNRELNLSEEELRLQNSSELMYGNEDYNQIFPFDVRMRFKYLVYHEAIGITEDGQEYSKVSTRRFSFINPSDWDNKYFPKGKKSFFEKQQKRFIILHDPIKQANFEGVKIKGYHIDKTGLSLKDKLKNAKPASHIGRALTPMSPVVVTTSSSVVETLPETETKTVVGTFVQQATIKRAGRPRKEVTND